MVIMEKREIPKPYIEKALLELRLMKFDEGKEFDIDVLEIGCMRLSMDHPVEDRGACCCDGHSTYLWAKTGWKVTTVDISGVHLAIAREACGFADNVSFIKDDAFNFLSLIENSSKHPRIGILFLDAWDVDLPGCAEDHLRFFKGIMKHLSDETLVLIDDTDIYWDDEKKEFFLDPGCLSGKGRLLIPYMIEKGYEIVFKGRQTLLRKA